MCVDDRLDEVLVSIFKGPIPIRAKTRSNILSWLYLYPATNNPIVASQECRMADPDGTLELSLTVNLITGGSSGRFDLLR
jgi:hypothetical protein